MLEEQKEDILRTSPEEIKISNIISAVDEEIKTLIVKKNQKRMQ